MPGVESVSPCSTPGDLGPAQETQKAAEEGATEVTTMGTVEKGVLLGPTTLPRPGPGFGLQDISPCS